MSGSESVTVVSVRSYSAQLCFEVIPESAWWWAEAHTGTPPLKRSRNSVQRGAAARHRSPDRPPCATSAARAAHSYTSGGSLRSSRRMTSAPLSQRWPGPPLSGKQGQVEASGACWKSRPASWASAAQRMCPRGCSWSCCGPNWACGGWTSSEWPPMAHLPGCCRISPAPPAPSDR